VSVQTQSLLSVLIGGIAFETPATDPVLPAADADTVFPCSPTGRRPTSRPRAIRIPTCSSSGIDPWLSQGAPVEFRGVPIGEVVGISPQFDAKTERLHRVGDLLVDPRMLGVKVVNDDSGDASARRKRMVEALMARGFRAQLRSGNLLTGRCSWPSTSSPNAPPVTVDWSRDPVRAGDRAGPARGARASVASIVRRSTSCRSRGSATA